MRPHKVALHTGSTAAFRLGATLIPIVFGAALLGASPIALAQDKDVTIVLQEEPFSVEPCDANTSIIGKVLKQNIVETLVDKDAVDGSLAAAARDLLGAGRSVNLALPFARKGQVPRRRRFRRRCRDLRDNASIVGSRCSARSR